ncbi:MAG: hypothetical protein QXJ64_08030 [Thermosphaera sp.]
MFRLLKLIVSLCMKLFSVSPKSLKKIITGYICLVIVYIGIEIINKISPLLGNTLSNLAYFILLGILTFGAVEIITA